MVLLIHIKNKSAQSKQSPNRRKFAQSGHTDWVTGATKQCRNPRWRILKCRQNLLKMSHSSDSLLTAPQACFM
jgi:hypothetical protein